MKKVLNITVENARIIFSVTDIKGCSVIRESADITDRSDCTDLLSAADRALCIVKERLPHYFKNHRIGAVTVASDIKGALALDESENIVSDLSSLNKEELEADSVTLSELLNYNIPEYYALSGYCSLLRTDRAVISKIRKITTVAGYLFFKLTGEFNLGYSECSSLFPLSGSSPEYCSDYREKLLLSKPELEGFFSVLPKPCALLDRSAFLKNEFQGCNSQNIRTAVLPPQTVDSLNLLFSCGNSLRLGNTIVLCSVLDKPFENAHRECESFTGANGQICSRIENQNANQDLNEWLELFFKAFSLIESDGVSEKAKLDFLTSALSSDDYESNLMIFNQMKEDPFSFIQNGRPMIIRNPNKKLTLSDFVISHFLSMMMPVKLASRILRGSGVRLDSISLSGGYSEIEKIKELSADVFEAEIRCADVDGKNTDTVSQELLGSFLLSGITELNEFREHFKNTKASWKKSEKGVKRARLYAERYVLCLGLERQAAQSFLR